MHNALAVAVAERAIRIIMCDTEQLMCDTEQFNFNFEVSWEVANKSITHFKKIPACTYL